MQAFCIVCTESRDPEPYRGLFGCRPAVECLRARACGRVSLHRAAREALDMHLDPGSANEATCACTDDTMRLHVSLDALRLLVLRSYKRLQIYTE